MDGWMGRKRSQQSSCCILKPTTRLARGIDVLIHFIDAPRKGFLAMVPKVRPMIAP